MFEEQVQPSTWDVDVELEASMGRSARALERLGITVQDILDALPAARAAVLEETYGAEFMQEIERQITEYHQQSAESQPLRQD